MNGHMSKVLTSVIALVAFGGFVWGAQSYLYTNYASASDLKKLENRFDVKVKEDQLFNVQERIWRLEDRYEKKTMSDEAKEQYRMMLKERDKLEEDLRTLKDNK